MPQVEVEYSIVNDYSSSIANISNSGLIQALNLGYFAFIPARLIENLLWIRFNIVMTTTYHILHHHHYHHRHYHHQCYYHHWHYHHPHCHHYCRFHLFNISNAARKCKDTCTLHWSRWKLCSHCLLPGFTIIIIIIVK